VITPNYLGPTYMYLWSPNHDCTEWNVNSLATVTDNCSGPVAFGIAGSGCDGCMTTQPILGGGLGSGNHAPDCCVNDGPCGSDATRATFRVREERNGNDDIGEDRAYFVDSQAMDPCGNSARMLLGICVVHDSSGASTASCDYAGGLISACPGPDNHPNRGCYTPRL
jgi:hypothetical protein